MKKNITMILIAVASMLFSAALIAGEELYKSDFSAGAPGWSGKKNNETGKMETAEFHQIVKDDNQDCLKISIAGVTPKCAPWMTGASLLLDAAIAEGQKIKFSFKAKSLAGARFLVINRGCGGWGTDAGKLTNEWKQFDLEICCPKYSLQEFLFSLVAGPKSMVMKEGQFLLKDVSITTIDEEAAAPAVSSADKPAAAPAP